LDIAVDLENTKWIGTWGGGLSRFDGKRWTTYTAGNGTIGGNFVHALEIDLKGNLWAATNKGVSRFDGKSWKTYTTADGLLDDNVFSIAFDKDGNKWFGTWTGLSKMIDG
jgi:ligand-binding sensor domain-containing protein